MDNMDKLIKELIVLLEKKQEHLKNILHLTKEQSKLIADENIDELEKNVTKKQAYIDQINDVDNDFNRVYEEFKDKQRVVLESGLRLEIEDLSDFKQKVKQVMDLMKQISELEESNNKNAADVLEKYSENIKKINQARKIDDAYGNKPIINPSYYIDKKK